MIVIKLKIYPNIIWYRIYGIKIIISRPIKNSNQGKAKT
jgi:hypothetical protein